jgi:hypothetical protein
MTYSYRVVTVPLLGGTILKVYKVNEQEFKFSSTEINDDMIVRLRIT